MESRFSLPFWCGVACGTALPPLALMVLRRALNPPRSIALAQSSAQRHGQPHDGPSERQRNAAQKHVASRLASSSGPAGSAPTTGTDPGDATWGDGIPSCYATGLAQSSGEPCTASPTNQEAESKTASSSWGTPAPSPPVSGTAALQPPTGGHKDGMTGLPCEDGGEGCPFEEPDFCEPACDIIPIREGIPGLDEALLKSGWVQRRDQNGRLRYYWRGVNK
jgi:hypothetical protein